MIKKILLFLMFVFFSTSFVSAASSLNVVLSSQNPDPVEPGNFVYVNVKVSNSGSDSIGYATINFVENSNFKIAGGTDIKKDLGSIPAYSNLDTSSSYVIAKFKLYVDENTPQGLNTVSFQVVTDIQVYSYDFDILVEEVNPKIIIDNLKVNTIEAGSNQELEFDLKNVNHADLSDVIVSLQLNNVENKVFSTAFGTNQKIFSNLASGSSKKVKFDISVIPNAVSKQYLLPILVQFQDASGKLHSQNLTASIRVYSEPILSLKLDSQDIYTTGNAKITFAIANPGVSTVKGVEVEILKDNSYEVIEGNFQYVGNLNPDDFQTIQSQIYLKNSSGTVLKVKVNYLDSYNVLKEKILEIPVKMYSNDELVNFGLGGVDKSNSTSTSTIIFIIIVGIIAFFIGRKFGYKKAKKSKN